MLTLIFAILLAALTLTAVSLQKAYTHLPLKELKRRSRAGDEFANVLYKAVAYGSSVQVLLWLIIGICASSFFVIISRGLSVWLALIVTLGLVWLGFAWIPNTRVSRYGQIAAKYLTSPLAWLLGHLYPILNRFTSWLAKYRHVHVHTGLYEKEDFINLLENQKHQSDNRISEDELRIAAGALTYGSKIVRDVMTPRREVKTVATTDSIGPHLMDELHGSGHSRFPVYQDKPDNFVGMLYTRDLISASHGGHVKDLMKKDVYYVHEEQSLSEVLNAFLKTKHHLFVVVNSFEEVAGVITIEDILEQIVGKPIVDEFDKYNDIRAVAAIKAKAEHQNQIPEEGAKETKDTSSDKA